MAQREKLDRRRFLLLGCSTLCSAALGSGCTTQQVRSDQITACPFGEVNDPHPGKCHRYIDANNNGICDLSESTDQTKAPSEEETATGPLSATTSESADAGTATPTPSPAGAPTDAPARRFTRCPRGLVKDPYPGRCRLYIDRSGNRICDLSESA